MVYILYQVFQAPGAFLSDTIALENLERTGRPFGRVRLMGSIGWAVSGLLIGALLGRNVELFVPMAVVTGFALFAVQRSLPKVQGHMQKSARSFRSIGTFLKNRAVYPVLIAEAGFSFGMSLTSIFLLARFESLGGTTGMYGLFLFLATMTEIPYLFYGDRIVKRFGTTKVLVAVAITSALRLFTWRGCLLGSISSPWLWCRFWFFASVHYHVHQPRISAGAESLRSNAVCHHHRLLPGGGQLLRRFAGRAGVWRGVCRCFLGSGRYLRADGGLDLDFHAQAGRGK